MSFTHDLWNKMPRPAMVLAPMVDASELAWRLLGRRHGATIAFSPMFHSVNFVKDARYRREALQTCAEDCPLVIQFCGNNVALLLTAAQMAQDYCDAIDLNLGCPQAIAKRGLYGAYLQEDWSRLSAIVSVMSGELRIPVSCKVRVFESIDKTVEYAKMLEEAGCSLLTVHGRTREQKGPLTGLASWAHIKAVKENVKIPVIGNGNVQCLEDVKRFIEETGVDGVMSAEGHLTNPYIFEGLAPPVWQPALEYLELVDRYPSPNAFVRGHLFKLFHKLFRLKENAEIREEIAKGSSIDQFRNAVLKLKEKYLPIHEGEQSWDEPYSSYDLFLPPWICQSYVRMSPEEYTKKMAEKSKEAQEKENCKTEEKIRFYGNGEITLLSKKKLKRMARGLTKRKVMTKCVACLNPMSLKCMYSLCKTCCKKKCYIEGLDCKGHNFLVKTKRQKVRQLGMKKSKSF
nr:tRNA-dihydrouridine(16/17) synthase [NAD(P)(+)]-like [Halyomorpha halys]